MPPGVETKEPLDESERGEQKSWQNSTFKKMKIMASSPSTTWQINGDPHGGEKRKGNKKCLQGLKRKSLLMKVKEESKKAGKTQHSKK